MPKLRVYQLARELNRDNSEIIRELQHMGVPVTSHSNTVEDRLADQLRKKLGVLEIAEPVQAAPPAVPEEIIVQEPIEAVLYKPEPLEAAPPKGAQIEAPPVPARTESP